MAAPFAAPEGLIRSRSDSSESTAPVEFCEMWTTPASFATELWIAIEAPEPTEPTSSGTSSWSTSFWAALTAPWFPLSSSSTTTSSSAPSPMPTSLMSASARSSPRWLRSPYGASEPVIESTMPTV